MPQFVHPLIFSIVLSAVSSFTAAQTTYKCGNSYSETPCADGKAVVNQDLRTEDQKRQADETTRRQKSAASGFEKDRIAQEKRDAKALREADKGATIGKKAEPVARMRPKPKLIKPPKPAKPVKATKKKKTEKSANQF